MRVCVVISFPCGHSSNPLWSPTVDDSCFPLSAFSFEHVAISIFRLTNGHPLLPYFSFSLIYSLYFISSSSFSSPVMLVLQIPSFLFHIFILPTPFLLCLCSAGQSGSVGTGQPLVNAIRSDSALIGGTVAATCFNVALSLSSIMRQKLCTKPTGIMWCQVS